MTYCLNERNIIITESDETEEAISTSNNIKMIKMYNNSNCCIDNNAFLNELSPSDCAKKAAAVSCGEAEVKSGMNLGIGSGSTMKFFIDWLKESIQNGHLKNLKCVSTSFQVCILFKKFFKFFILF
jgi:hypothetical protein